MQGFRHFRTKSGWTGLLSKPYLFDKNYATHEIIYNLFRVRRSKLFFAWNRKGSTNSDSHNHSSKHNIICDNLYVGTVYFYTSDNKSCKKRAKPSSCANAAIFFFFPNLFSRVPVSTTLTQKEAWETFTLNQTLFATV